MIHRKKRTKQPNIVIIVLILLILSLSSSFPLTAKKSSTSSWSTQRQIQPLKMSSSIFPSKSSSSNGIEDKHRNSIQESNTRRIRILNPISFLFGNAISTANAFPDGKAMTSTHSSQAWETSKLQSKATESSFDTSVSKYFPGAMPVSQIAETVIQILTQEHNYNPSNTLWATTICPDEVNHHDGSLIQILQQKFGSTSSSSFALGGLAGIPFAGISGLSACLHHVPQPNGKLILVGGPHVGITEDGHVGKVIRHGQSHESTACGAANAAYVGRPSTSMKSSINILDYQEDYLIRILNEKRNSSSTPVPGSESSGSDGMVWVTKTLYDIIWDIMFQELKAVQGQDESFWSTVTEISVLGGILINRNDKGPESMDASEDFFQPLMFQILNANGIEDLSKKTFRFDKKRRQQHSENSFSLK
jgi:hypothetical protein